MPTILLIILVIVLLTAGPLAHSCRGGRGA
jgi:hypothetical protein